VIEATWDGKQVAASELPATVRERAASELATADPLLDVQFHFTCPACACEWHSPFDPLSFLWHEIDGWARRTLGEVAQLAARFGWAERDILSLSAWRRSFYLEMV
jgi:hypothetical protein